MTVLAYPRHWRRAWLSGGSPDGQLWTVPQRAQIAGVVRTPRTARTSYLIAR